MALERNAMRVARLWVLRLERRREHLSGEGPRLEGAQGQGMTRLVPQVAPPPFFVSARLTRRARMS